MSNEQSSSASGTSFVAAQLEARILNPRLFRKTDWLTFFITFLAVWVVYFVTLGPEVTLEDSGELVTGSMYAGIPHPPGYPVWTLYSWLWTVLLPVGNMAWRVSVGQAFSGAMACGLLAMMVSRGSSMFVEGIEELKVVAGKWESAICLVSGFAAGMLVGLDRFVWSESVVVNRIAVFSMPWVMLVLVCLMRWLYAPGQLRYAYLAALLFGVCITIHQSLVVAAIAIEIFIALGNPRLGRYAFLGNFVIYLAYMLVYLFTNPHVHLMANIGRPGMFVIFNFIGLGSLPVAIWLFILTGIKPLELARDISFLAILGCLVPAVRFSGNRTLLTMLVLAAIVLIVISGYLIIRTWRIGREWLTVIAMAVLFFVGVGFYFYMPIACMTNPPMEWCYPRTVDGFIHALTRGQYDQPNPTNVLTEPLHFLDQLGALVKGLSHEFTWSFLLFALVPFLFLFKMRKRERAWLIGLAGMYFCLGVLLTILLNPNTDRTTEDLMRVFFTSSHTIVALLIGHGLALTAAYMAGHYQRFRLWGLAGGVAAVVLAVCSLFEVTGRHYFGPAGRVEGPLELVRWVGQAFAKGQYGLPIFGGLVLVGLTAAFVFGLVLYSRRAPLLLTLGLFALMPLYSALSHYGQSEERNHWFGYWFGHDMFTPPFKQANGLPLYPQMATNAVLFGGTDPGRFCPTYMIFCDSFIPHDCQPAEDQHFDRRDVYLITQNALADSPYLCYIRAQYNRSAQIDPPFFQDLARPEDERRQNTITNRLALLLSPITRPLDQFFAGIGERVEKRRRTYTSWFATNDFINLPALAARLQPGPQQHPLAKYLYDRLDPETRNLLAAGDSQLLRRSLAKDLNAVLDSGPLYEPARFQQVHLSEYLLDFIKQDPQSYTRVRLNRLLLEAAYPKELAKSPGAVYPDREIYTPTSKDLDEQIAAYQADVSRRLQLNQLDPGEAVSRDGNRLQISGQISVMAINGLLAKVIFDHNPKNEFYVEESLPLKWMYPYLSPYGIIMKVNRQPLPQITEEMVRRDHEFWSRYSERLVGNWITYDTPVTNIVAWVEKVYLRHNLDGFTGNPKFILDDEAQKAFSKLRSAIAGVYIWRIGDPQNTDPAVQQRMIKEADFACRQAFALCPYSPESVSHCVSLLANEQHFDDALLIAQTCCKLDPYNGWFVDLTNRVAQWRTDTQSSQTRLRQLQLAAERNPDDFQADFDLAGAYLQRQQPADALKILDGVLNSAKVDPAALRVLLQAYAGVNNAQRVLATVNKLQGFVAASPTNSQAVIALSEGLRELQNTNAANQALDQLLENPQADATGLVQLAQQYADLGNLAKVEIALEKLSKLRPDSPETWYDLAALKAILGKSPEAYQYLGQSLDLSAKRSKLDPKAKDLYLELQTDPRFASLRSTPEFMRLTNRAK